MKATYGSYNHDNEHVELVSYKNTKFFDDSDGTFIGDSIFLTIRFTLHGDDQDALKTKITAALTAYGNDGEDFIWKHDDGTTNAEHSLIQPDPVGLAYNRVNEVRFAEGKGVEYASKRTMEVDLQKGVVLRSGNTAQINNVIALDSGLSNAYRAEYSVESIPSLPIIERVTLPVGYYDWVRATDPGARQRVRRTVESTVAYPLAPTAPTGAQNYTTTTYIRSGPPSVYGRITAWEQLL